MVVRRSPRQFIAKAGWRIIGGKRLYFRSKMEGNYARYLEWLKSHNKIQNWEHEPDTFWFEAIKRGVRSYLPDFKVTNLDGNIEYHETKGFFDKKSYTKIKRLSLYYPEVKLVLINHPTFRLIEKSIRPLIQGWE